jgi:outer membrane protein TolC
VFAFSLIRTEAQQISLSDVLAKTEQSSARIKAAMLGIESQMQLEKSSFNLSQPQLLVQAPTGNFYTLGVQQNFDFPSVYSARKKLLQSETEYAKRSAELKKFEVRYFMSDLYVQWQAAEARYVYYSKLQMDLIQIRDAAMRSFEAGEIGMIEKSFADLKYLDASRALEESSALRNSIKQSMMNYVGMDESVMCDSLLTNLRLVGWENISWRSVMVELALADVKRSEMELQVRRRQNMPGFFVGYMNQGERNSLVENRFNAGISIPLWFWHTKSSLRSSKLKVEQYRKEAEAVQQEMDNRFLQSKSRHDILVQSVLSLQNESLPISKEMAASAKRLFDSGEISLTEYLRLKGDAVQTELTYIELVEELLKIQNQLQFITSFQ